MHIFNPDPSHFSSCLGTCSSSQLTLAFCGCIRSVKVHCTKFYCGYYAQQLLMISAHICEGYCSCLVCMCLSVCYPLAASVFTPSTNGLFLSGFRQTILMACVHNVSMYVYTDYETSHTHVHACAMHTNSFEMFVADSHISSVSTACINASSTQTVCVARMVVYRLCQQS